MSEKKKGNINNLVPHQYQKGESGNRSGRPKELLTKDRVSKIISEFSSMNPEEIRAVAENPESTMIELMIASIVMQVVKSGDVGRLNFLFERSPVGRFKDSDPSGRTSSTYQQIMNELKKFQSDEA
jgi:hypothetical protein